MFGQVFGQVYDQAWAADLPAPAPQPAAPALPALPSLSFLPQNILITVGVGAEATNAFPGAQTYSGFPIPYIDWRKPGDPPPFHAPDDGFGLTIFDFGMFRAGPVGRYVPERGTGADGTFIGLPSIPWTIEVGGFVEFWPTDFLRARAEVRQAVDGHDGLDANLAVDALGHFGAWTLSLGPRAAFGDTQFEQTYFSVTPTEASINGHITPFAATGGITSVGFLATAKYEISQNWSVLGFAGYNRLVGSAGESPITNNIGSKNDFIGGAIIEYSFVFGGF